MVIKKCGGKGWGGGGEGQYGEWEEVVEMGYGVCLHGGRENSNGIEDRIVIVMIIMGCNCIP